MLLGPYAPRCRGNLRPEPPSLTQPGFPSPRLLSLVQSCPHPERPGRPLCSDGGASKADGPPEPLGVHSPFTPASVAPWRSQTHAHTCIHTCTHSTLIHTHTALTAHSYMCTHPCTSTHVAPCCSRVPSAPSSQEGPHLHQHPEAPSVLSFPEGSPLLGVSCPPWGSSPTRPPWSLSRALSKPTCPGPTAGPAWTLHFLLECLLSSLGAGVQRGGGGVSLSNPQKRDA